MQVQTASGIGGVFDGDLGALRRGQLIRVYGLERVFIDLFDDIVHATGITAGRHPLGSLESMAGARSLSVSARNVVIAGRRSTNS